MELALRCLIQSGAGIQSTTGEAGSERCRASVWSAWSLLPLSCEAKVSKTPASPERFRGKLLLLARIICDSSVSGQVVGFGTRGSAQTP